MAYLTWMVVMVALIGGAVYLASHGNACIAVFLLLISGFCGVEAAGSKKVKHCPRCGLDLSTRDPDKE